MRKPTIPNWARALPKTVLIGACTYGIEYDPEIGGGYFNCSLRKITVGCRDGKESAWQTLLHEIIEIVMVEQYVRYQMPYQDPENGDYIFVFDHKQYKLIVQGIYQALRDCLKGW